MSQTLRAGRQGPAEVLSSGLRSSECESVVWASRLGLIRGRVRLAESDSSWESAFDQIAAELRLALKGPGVAIEHVGSTAVPGLAAKPIIDIAIGVRGEVCIDLIVRVLEPFGWIYRGDAADDGGQVFALDDQPDHRIAHLHVVSTDDPQWLRYLAFRDRLRHDAVARAQYEVLKRELADQFPEDRKAYTAAKESFIRCLVASPNSRTPQSSS